MNKTKIKVEALNDHGYDGVSRGAGTQYEIDPKDLHLMTVLGRVKVVTEKPKPPQPPVVTKPPVTEAKEVKPPTVRTPEGQYQRRDLRVKE